MLLKIINLEHSKFGETFVEVKVLEGQWNLIASEDWAADERPQGDIFAGKERLMRVGIAPVGKNPPLIEHRGHLMCLADSIPQSYTEYIHTPGLYIRFKTVD